jgi:small subunit ribosomal protein S2
MRRFETGVPQPSGPPLEPEKGDYIFGTRNNIHIIDLAQSVPMLHKALEAVSDVPPKAAASPVGTNQAGRHRRRASAARSITSTTLARRHLTNWRRFRFDRAAAR